MPFLLKSVISTQSEGGLKKVTKQASQAWRGFQQNDLWCAQPATLLPSFPY